MADKPLTWQEKLSKGLPLNTLEQVKADAERITLRRIRDAEEDAKAKLAQSQPVLLPHESPAEALKETSPKDSKKGN